jgi:hypothetical protein
MKIKILILFFISTFSEPFCPSFKIGSSIFIIIIYFNLNIYPKAFHVEAIFDDY